MAAGIPQIIADEIDSDAYVKNGVNGFLINGEDINEACEKIISLSENAEMRKKMSCECIKRVKNNFAPSKWGKKMIKIYNDLLFDALEDKNA
jgi:glycosyltransferase involved in cell wall biosynthesis